MKFILLAILVLGMIYPLTSFGYTSFQLDKNSYHEGDTIKISGKVDFKEDMALVIQIRSTTDIIAIEQLTPSKSGSYSTSFDASGPKWAESGRYTAIVSYAGDKSEKSFGFSINNIPEQPISELPAPQIESIQEQPQIQTKPKITMVGFPDPTHSPNYYINLYNTDPDFKKLFDTSFPGYQIQELVSYKSTHFPGFPDNDLSQQYYIDRYFNEQRFQLWFNSQFPNETIYDVLGMSENTRPSIPSWIKQYALLWSQEQITDSQFAFGISELIQNKILLISDDIVKTTNSDKNIPEWFKNIARWYSEGIITDDDFLFGLQFLIEKGIIVL